MADTKLILRIDNLAHKLISAESEIAFGETFDIIFEGLENYSGKTAGVYLDDISGTQNLWGIDAAIQTVDGKACIQNCVINTEEALEVLTFDEVETRLSFYLKSVGYSTYYGETSLRLHPGKNDDGETYTELVSSIEQHDADPNSHLDIRTELGNVRRETISSVNTILTDHKSTEKAERDQAIANAISESEAKLTNAFDTSFAATESRINAKAEEVEGYRGETEAFRDEAEALRDEAEAFRDEAKSAEGSVKSIQSAVTNTASAVARQAEACAAAQEVVVSKAVEVEELHSAVTNLVGDIDRIEDVVENLDEIVETETPKIEAAARTAQAAATTAQQMVDSINYSFDTWSDASVVDGNFIGPAQKDGVQPRLHNRNKDIHGVTGFSGDTYHNARFLLDWRLAMSNDQSYLASYACWTADRKLGGGTVTFSQPLMPPNEGTDTRFSYAIPNFENSPLFWSGHFVYNEPNANGEYTANAKQIKLDWSKVNAGGQGTIALMSDVDAVADRVTAVEEELATLTPNESVFDVVAVSGTDIILDATKAYYAKTLTESEYTFAIDASGLTLDDKIAKINLLLSIGTVEPTITFPASVNFIDEVQFGKASQTMLELTSIGQGASWIAKVKFSRLAYAYEVEYIEATGTQYLDTGTAPLKASYSFEGVFLSTNTSKGNLLGVTQTGTGIANAINGPTSMYYRVFSDTAALFGTPTPLTTAFHTYGYNGSNFYILDENGAECPNSSGSTEKTSDADITSPITLFFRNNTANSFGLGRCKSFWIKDEDGTLLLDLIPVVSWEGVACMYDRVSAQLIKSATADAFVAGPRID